MQRKVFRIERMLAPRRHESALRDPRPDETRTRAGVELPSGNVQVAAIQQELDAVRRAILAAKRELAAAAGENQIARTASELKAVVADTERATDDVLRHVEQIDEDAKTLAAALKHENNRALAQDIQERVIAIYEACNFQDVAGQRIGNALSALRAIESRIDDALGALQGTDAKSRATAQKNDLLNGPKLEGDTGHASQSEIDRLFG